MRFHILGPLRVSADGTEITPQGARNRAFLGELLVHSGSVVSAEHIIEATWPDRPPVNAANAVQVRISRQRSMFRELAGAETAAGVLRTHPSGYQLQPVWLDSAHFESQVERARRLLAAGELTDAARTLEAALGLWQGEAYADVPPSECVALEACRLGEVRLDALELHSDALLRLGRTPEVVSRLRTVTERHPLRERLHGHLITALHRSGRLAEALAAYADLRRVLIEELGTEPGPELQELHQAMLTGQVEPAQPAFACGGVTSGAIPPRQLPPDIGDFTGRAREADNVLAALEGDGGGCLPIAAIVGRGGTGKSALAVHTAHRLRERFPDGQLYADLRGHRVRPARPEEVLARFLVDLGVDRDCVPDDLDARTALFRSVLADTRVLVVLDGAADEAQVRPLLPGSATCGVLVTSRGRLTALPGVSRVELGELEPATAREFLARVVGRHRVTASPWSMEEIGLLCDRLPLALRAAGARLLANPHLNPAELAAGLADDRRRIKELGHGAAEVRASLADECRRLSSLERRLLRHISVFHRAGVSAVDAAGLLRGTTVDQVRGSLDRLVEVSLVVPGPRDTDGRFRFRLGNLARAYAQECFAREADLLPEVGSAREEAISVCP
ncbi:BTAD domain-containing putative transcriptional regulator [Streptomyces sp. NPDC059629]|uniref:AfsR/SARP family transcriptional regulator n=1 Tax=Streptomyces sp. NPDC059629 TaxID=3346889 RepID=UPI0036A3B3AA